MHICFTYDVDLPLSNCPNETSRFFAAGEAVELASIHESLPLEEGQEATFDFYFRGNCWAYGVPKNLFTIQTK